MAAAAAAWYARGAYKKQSEQADLIREREFRSQASRFAIWLAHDPADHSMLLRYSNASGLPVFHVYVVLHHRPSNSVDIAISELAPTTDTEEVGTAGALTGMLWQMAADSLGYNDVEDAFQKADESDWFWQLMAHSTKMVHGGLTVFFTDCQGYIWRRNNAGELNPIDEKTFKKERDELASEMVCMAFRGSELRTPSIAEEEADPH